MEKRTKILSLIAAILVLTGLAAFIGGLHILFPKAPPVRLPKDYERIIVTPFGSAEEETLAREDAELLLDILRKAKPTRRMSVNDTPNTKNYTAFTIHTPNGETPYARFYLYEGNGRLMMEIPYGGIYLVNDPEHRISGRWKVGINPAKEQTP
ncbi:MAG: DUF5301 domain-containing protein [Clostridiales bacterium]|nr:DUF5301 domain-containing protein [Clostridiales bacterium]